MRSESESSEVLSDDSLTRAPCSCQLDAIPFDRSVIVPSENFDIPSIAVMPYSWRPEGKLLAYHQKHLADHGLVLGRSSDVVVSARGPKDFKVGAVAEGSREESTCDASYLSVCVV